jgi:Transglycosylase-like domain
VRVRSRNFVAIVGALSLSGGAMAAAAEPQTESIPEQAGSKLVERPGDRLMTVIEAHQEFDALRDSYRKLAEQAAAVGLDVDGQVPEDVTSDKLRNEVAALRKRVEKAEDANVVAGVPMDTLEAIASCESGGDPTAVSSDGSYRGKYQFDRGTWASVGGTGDPAAAPEAEQDYRAALLYQRAGSSPWPICGS